MLIAEDETLIALLLSDLMEAEGHDVHVACDGIAALEAAQRLGTSLDILITDLNMPGMTGEDLICALSAARPLLPVVVITGSPPIGGLEELRRRCGGHQPLALLEKPVPGAEVVAAVQRMFEGIGCL